MECGALFVRMAGMILMLLLCADNWDSLIKVLLGNTIKVLLGNMYMWFKAVTRVVQLLVLIVSVN